MSDSAQLTKADLPEIVKRYASGESIQSIAADAGVHRATLYRWMLAGQGDADYGELITHCLVQRVADADQMLMSAADACDIARAREVARFARMDLERRRPQLYGQRQQLQVVAISAIDAPGTATKLDELLGRVCGAALQDVVTIDQDSASD